MTGDRALRDLLLGMTAEEIREYWKARQLAERDAGRPHYSRLVDGVTGATRATIEEDR